MHCARRKHLVLDLFVALLAAPALAASALTTIAGEGVPWQLDPRRALAPASAEAFARLNEGAELDFAFHADERGNAVRVFGGQLATGTSDRALAARRFLAEYRELFGLSPELGLTVSVRGAAPARAQVHFSAADIAIEGATATILFDPEGRIRGARVSAPESIVPLGGFTHSAAEAEPAARAELVRERARLGRARSASWLSTDAVRAWVATPGGLEPAWRLELSSAEPGESYRVFVSERDGRALRWVDQITTAHQGYYPWFDLSVPFETADASGMVFADVQDAIDGVITKRKLRGWALGVPAPAGIEAGYLIGARADVWDALHQRVFAPSGKLEFSLYWHPDAFDQVNTYFQIEDYYRYLEKRLGVTLASDLALPALVNIKAPTLNAFFSWGAFPYDGHCQGWMAFYDPEVLAGPAGDFSRDPSVVAHEYTHAWVFFEGEAFMGALDDPTRAVGEAIADYYACSKLEETVVGRYVEHVYQLDIARDLQDDDHFPETTNEALALSVTGLPEEHRSGEVLGSMLTDLRLAIGRKQTERLVYRALAFMPDTMAEVGYAAVDPASAIGATADTFGACAIALLVADTQGKSGKVFQTKHLGPILGAAVGRGVLENGATTMSVLVDLEALPGRKLAIPSRFVVPGEHTYRFLAAPNRNLTVRVQGASAGDVEPDFVVSGALGEPGALLEHEPKVFQKGGRKVMQKRIELLLPSGSGYSIRVSSQGLGAYELVLDV